jgi:hypothetical protein
MTTDFEDELDAIRITQYEETKNMTPDERVTYINEKADKIIERYGIKCVYPEEIHPKENVV